MGPWRRRAEPVHARISGQETSIELLDTTGLDEEVDQPLSS